MTVLIGRVFQDYEVRIASLQEQVDRNSMMSSMIRYDVEPDEEEDDSKKCYDCYINRSKLKCILDRSK